MSDKNYTKPKTEIEYVFAFIKKSGEVIRHFASERYATIDEAKPNANKIVDMLPEPVREHNTTYLIEVTTTYKVIESV